MSRTRVACLCLAGFICQAVLIADMEWAPTSLLADQPPGKQNQSKQSKGKKKPSTDHKETKPHAADPNLLSLEVKALRTLRGLEATPAQLAELARIAKTTAAKSGKREPAKAAATYVDALAQLRDALIAGDEEKIETHKEKLDDLQEKETPDLDDDVEITDAAEIEAARVLNTLTPRQVASYADGLGDDLPEPVQSIVDVLQDSSELKGEEWQAARDELADRISWLVAGMNGDKTSKVEEQVSAFLDRKHASPGNAGELQPEIRKLLGSSGPIVLLQHIVEHDVAELLSNPQLARATKACLRAQGEPLTAAADQPTPRAVRPDGEKPQPAPTPRKSGTAKNAAKSAAKNMTPKNAGKNAGSKAAVADLDAVLKEPEKYQDQDVKFENVTVTGTSPGRGDNFLWLEIKTPSGETVRGAMKGQKLTFVITKSVAPESIAQMSSGATVTATLTCHILGTPQGKHWNARVKHVEVQGTK